jgi:hypothetical protein
MTKKPHEIVDGNASDIIAMPIRYIISNKFLVKHLILSIRVMGSHTRLSKHLLGGGCSSPFLS